MKTNNNIQDRFRVVRDTQEADADACRTLEKELTIYHSKFHRDQFISWLKENKVGRHVSTYEECEHIMAKVGHEVGGFSPRCAQRMLTFFKAAEDKIAVRAVTSALRKMLNGLVNDYTKLIEEAIR